MGSSLLPATSSSAAGWRAWELLDRPLDAIPIDDVVSAAGVAKGSFFNHFVEMALEHSELSPRELAVRFTDKKRYFVSEASVYRNNQGKIAATPTVAPACMKAARHVKGTGSIPSSPRCMWMTIY